MNMLTEPIYTFCNDRLAISASLGRQHTFTPARLYGMQKRPIDAVAGLEETTRTTMCWRLMVSRQVRGWTGHLTRVRHKMGEDWTGKPYLGDSVRLTDSLSCS